MPNLRIVLIAYTLAEGSRWGSGDAFGITVRKEENTTARFKSFRRGRDAAAVASLRKEEASMAGTVNPRPEIAFE